MNLYFAATALATHNLSHLIRSKVNVWIVVADDGIRLMQAIVFGHSFECSVFRWGLKRLFRELAEEK